jgi:5-methylcytosine-specific restriction endonuclease McrA
VKRINSMVKHELRKALCNAFSGLCAYCRRRIGMKGTVDHYMPQALGGTNARENLRWCCTACNCAKADMHPDEWELLVPGRVCAIKTKAQQRIEILASIAPQSRKNQAEGMAP